MEKRPVVEPGELIRAPALTEDELLSFRETWERRERKPKVKGIERYKTIEGMLGLKKSYIKVMLQMLEGDFPDIRSMEPEKKAKALLNFLKPTEIIKGELTEEKWQEYAKQHGTWILKKPVGHLDNHPTLLALLRTGWGNCMARALFFRVLARHIGLDDKTQGTRCRVALMPEHAVVFLTINEKKVLADPTHGVLGKEPAHMYYPLKEMYDEAFEVEDVYAVYWLKASLAEKPKIGVKYYTLFHKKYPDYAECLNNRGILYKTIGELGKALNDYNKALQLKPNDAECLNNRGNLYKTIGELGKALNDYNKSLQLKPDYAECLNNRGILYKTIGELGKALADLKKALALFKARGQEQYAEIAELNIMGVKSKMKQ
ncbi:MAG: tetratricopeptide repeat protein [archaeon]